MFGKLSKMITQMSKKRRRARQQKRKTPINPLKSAKVTKVLSKELKATETKIIHRKNSKKDSDNFLEALNSMSFSENDDEGYQAGKKSTDDIHSTYRNELAAAPEASGRASRLTGRASSFRMRNIQNIGSFKLDRSISFAHDDKKIRTYQMALKEIQVLSHIGRGMIAEVYLGLWRGVLVALKTLRTSNGHECSLNETAKQLFQEIAILSELKHKHIVSFVGSSIGRDHMMLVTEYMPDGELYEFLRSRQNRDYSLHDAVCFARDIASAMEYLHGKQMLQCDLKTANVLLTAQKTYVGGNSSASSNATSSSSAASSSSSTSTVTISSSKKMVKLNDFGSAVNADKADHTMGTVFNAAPELLSGKCVNTYKTDVYAFSMIMWELIARTDPYQYIPVICLPLVISNGRRPYLSKIKRSSVPFEYIDLMEQCWHPVPSCRPSFHDIQTSLHDLANQTSETNVHIHAGSEPLPKRDMDRTDKMFKRFLLSQREHDAEVMLQNGNHGHKSNRGHTGDKTLDLEFFRSMVLNSGEKMSSFDAMRKKPNESPGKDQVAEEIEQDSPPSNGVFGIATTNSSMASSSPSSLACSSVSDMTKIGMEELCDDLQAQTISKRIDKWHLVSALATLRETSMSSYSIVMAACEVDGKKSAENIDYSITPVQRQASWSAAASQQGYTQMGA